MPVANSELAQAASMPAAAHAFFIELYNLYIIFSNINYLLDSAGTGAPRDLDLQIGQANVLGVHLETAAWAIVDQKSKFVLYKEENLTDKEIGSIIQTGG